ncbi:MAG: hypothetical protein QM619_11045 [Micropruina sp.]|uniref:hypothetical protein n=1 Tax=Micropruina sp. TaxID=2737536 RepID=UPI0039E61B76
MSDLTSALRDLQEIYGTLSADLRDRKVRRAIAEHFDELLRNPRFPYRRTATFAKLIGDTSADNATTRAILTGLIVVGVRGNLGATDTWVRPDNWVLDERGRVKRDANGHGVLRPGIAPGQL